MGSPTAGSYNTRRAPCGASNNCLWEGLKMPGFRPFRCLVVPFIAAARLPVGAKAAPSLPQGIKQADAKCLKLKDLDAKPATPNIEAGGFEEEEESKPTNREIALGSLKAALSYRQESTGECERRPAVPPSPRSPISRHDHGGAGRGGERLSRRLCGREDPARRGQAGLGADARPLRQGFGLGARCLSTSRSMPRQCPARPSA